MDHVKREFEVRTSDGYGLCVMHSVDDGPPAVTLVEVGPAGDARPLPPMTPNAARALAADLIEAARMVDPVGHAALAPRIVEELIGVLALAQLPADGPHH